MRSPNYFKGVIFSLLLLHFLFTACTKDHSSTENNQVVRPYPYEYVLTRQTWGNISFQRDVVEYFYNANNLVESIRQYAWRKNDLTNPDHVSEDELWFHFEYKNGLATKMSYNTRNGPDYIIYDYDAAGRPIRSTAYTSKYISHGDSTHHTQEVIPDFPFRMHTYLYDARGRFIEDRDSILETNQLVFRTVFEYGESDNALSKTFYSVTPSMQYKTRVMYVGYDDHPSYGNLVNGLPLGGNYQEYLYSFASNNYTEEQISYQPIPLDQEFGAWYINKRIFEYNNAGLPVKMTMNPDSDPHFVVEFEYKKISQ